MNAYSPHTSDLTSAPKKRDTFKFGNIPLSSFIPCTQWTLGCRNQPRGAFPSPCGPQSVRRNEKKTNSPLATPFTTPPSCSDNAAASCTEQPLEAFRFDYHLLASSTPPGQTHEQAVVHDNRAPSLPSVDAGFLSPPTRPPFSAAPLLPTPTRPFNRARVAG